MSIVPNELKITINTSIPGFQTIKYNPSMTIKNSSKDDKIFFNPLIKISDSVIKKIPENFKKKQFFDKGLFESLLNFTNKQPLHNLEESTREGVIDNNINVTINTIFPENSVIYIGGKPYVIADLQWSNGDWKIDTKKKKQEIDVSKIRNPLLYEKIVGNDIIEGEAQLRALNPALIYGPSFSDPTPLPPMPLGATGATGPAAPGPAAPEPAAPPVPPAPPGTPLLPPASVPPAPPGTPLLPPASVPPAPPGTLLLPAPEATEPPAPPGTLLLPAPEATAPEPPEVIPDPPAPPALAKKKLIPVIEPIDKLKPSRETARFRNVYQQRNMYYLINSIYGVISDAAKNIIRQMLENTTKTKIQAGVNLSLQAYRQQVESIRINNTPGDGNCFFEAVAQGINYYNYYNQATRIISGIYGTGTNLFTQLYLRRIVYDFIIGWDQLDEYFAAVAPTNVENLNALFSNALNERREILRTEGAPVDITNEEYVEIANNTYIANENFLVEYVNAVPIAVDDYERPFRIIDRGNLEDYILSRNYWGGVVSIIALCETLRLNVIPITINNEGRIFNSYNNFDRRYNNWNKYIFLYSNGNHFDLISFHYQTRQLVNSGAGKNLRFKNILTVKTIFKRTQPPNELLPNELPPIYMLFTIYGAFYSIMLEEGKRTFTYQNELMSIIDNAVIVLHDMPEYENFYNIFMSYFTTSRIPEPVRGELIEDDIEGDNEGENEGENEGDNEGDNEGEGEGGIEGGKRKFTKYKKSSNFLKANEYDKSKLAYYISIDLEVFPGTEMPEEEKKKLKCNKKWNNIRKAYAEFTGSKYIITPVYSDDKTKKNKNKGHNTTKKKN
jgi:hypothetical protein